MGANGKLEYYAATDVGLVREVNEDNYLVQPEKGLFVVADGMGGQGVGASERRDF